MNCDFESCKKLLSRSGDRSSRTAELAITISEVFLKQGKLFVAATDSKDIDVITAPLTVISQALRNCCSSAALVAVVQRTGLFDSVRQILLKIATTTYGIVVDAKLTAMLVQTTANATATGEEETLSALHAADHLYFRDMLAASSRTATRKTLGAALASIHNSVTKTRGNELREARVAALCSSKGLWRQLLLALLPPDNAAGGEDWGDEAIEWAHILICGLMSTSVDVPMQLLALTSAVADTTSVWDEDSIREADVFVALCQNEHTWRPTHEQLVLLQLIRDALEDRTYSWHELLTASAFRDFLRSVATQLGTLTLAQLVEVSEMGTRSLWFAAVPAAIGVLGASLAVEAEPESLRQLSMSLSDTGILQFSLCCLADLPVLESVADSHLIEVSDMQSILSAKDLPLEEKRQCLNELLSFVGNLLYRNPDAQDQFRVGHGFSVVLPHCATNFDSPMTREWALLCIRHACESNEENQAYVSSLTPQGKMVLKDSRMQEEGVRVEIDKVTNKFTVVHDVVKDI